MAQNIAINRCKINGNGAAERSSELRRFLANDSPAWYGSGTVWGDMQRLP